MRILLPETSVFEAGLQNVCDCWDLAGTLLDLEALDFVESPNCLQVRRGRRDWKNWTETLGAALGAGIADFEAFPDDTDWALNDEIQAIGSDGIWG